MTSKIREVRFGRSTVYEAPDGFRHSVRQRVVEHIERTERRTLKTRNRITLKTAQDAAGAAENTTTTNPPETAKSAGGEKKGTTS